MPTAYGFVDLRAMFGMRVQAVGSSRIWKAVEESAAEHSKTVNGLLSSLVERTTAAQEVIELSGNGTLQPLDDNGNPLPVRPSGSYTVAYPIQGGGTAWGDNRVTRQLMTVEEANRFTLDAQNRDADWISRHIMAALLTNTPWTFHDRVGENGSRGLGPVTVQPLANGDSVTYTLTGGASATDNHYLAQLAPISDADNPFPSIYTELKEHPSNMGGDYIAFVSSNLADGVRGLSTFVSIPDQDIATTILNDRLVRTPTIGFGALLGKVDGLWVAEWERLPANYLFAHATGGGPVLKMREYPTPALQGLFVELNDVDGNHKETRMIRYAGFGVANRVGAVAMQIGSASYTVPAVLTAPLAV